jgi:predicted  nucleic acid-binding Zn-ribbon protein
MKQNPYWFFQKWGISEPVPADTVSDKLQELEDRIKVLEEENIGLTNALYEIENSLDARIDIIAEKLRVEWDV